MRNTGRERGRAPDGSDEPKWVNTSRATPVRSRGVLLADTTDLRNAISVQRI